MAAPIFHGTGLSQFTIALALECKVVFQQRRFDPEATLRNIAEHRADVLVVVPTMLQRIIDVGADVTRPLRHVVAEGHLRRRVGDLAGPEPAHRGHFRRCALQPLRIHRGGGRDRRHARGDADRAGHRGPPAGGLPGRDLRREPQARSPNPTSPERFSSAAGCSFEGYTDGRNKEVVDGLLSSGDVGHFDRNGLLFVDGRDDDMIVSGGENVFPAGGREPAVRTPGRARRRRRRRRRSRLRKTPARLRRSRPRLGARRAGDQGLRQVQPGPLQGSPRHRVHRRDAPQRHGQDPSHEACRVGVSSRPPSARRTPRWSSRRRGAGRPSR